MDAYAGLPNYPDSSFNALVLAKQGGSFNGLRPDNTVKGMGWKGTLPMKDGSNKFATELTIGVNFDGKEMSIPLIVPTLTPDEINYLLSGGKETPEMVDKAVEHAKQRMKQGLSPYID